MLLLQAAQEKCDSHITKKYLQPAYNSADYLLCLVNDILTFSQIRNDIVLKYNFKQIQIRKEIQKTIQVLQLMADNKQIKLRAQIASDTPHECCTDPQRLKQILINLINNAIKFTFNGEITIIVKLL